MGTYTRSSNNRFYRRIFLISTEGAITEPEYFEKFESRYVHIECVREKCKSAPTAVLSRLKVEIDKRKMKEGDYAWMVIDRDEWASSEIDKLKAWVNDSSQATSLIKGLSVSNPKFELWLLLHFEDVTSGARSYVERLSQHLPGYDKHLDISKFPNDAVAQAISRAKALWGNDPTGEWPKTVGKTNVFVLCEAIKTAEEEGISKEASLWQGTQAHAAT